MSFFAEDDMKNALTYKDIYRLDFKSILGESLEENVQAEKIVCMTQEENELFASESRLLGSLETGKDFVEFKYIKNSIAMLLFPLIALFKRKKRYFL